MGKANKFAGGSGGKIGKVAYGNQISAQYAHMSPSRNSGSKASNYTKSTGTSSDNLTRSSHNDISRFTRSIQSGQYSSPSGTQHQYQQTNTETKSQPQNPSGASKVSQRVPNKKVAAPDKYNPRTPNKMKQDNIQKIGTGKQSNLTRLANNLKKK